MDTYNTINLRLFLQGREFKETVKDSALGRGIKNLAPSRCRLGNG